MNKAVQMFLCHRIFEYFIKIVACVLSEEGASRQDFSSPDYPGVCGWGHGRTHPVCFSMQFFFGGLHFRAYGRRNDGKKCW